MASVNTRESGVNTLILCEQWFGYGVNTQCSYSRLSVNTAVQTVIHNNTLSYVARDVTFSISELVGLRVVQIAASVRLISSIIKANRL